MRVSTSLFMACASHMSKHSRTAGLVKANVASHPHVSDVSSRLLGCDVYSFEFKINHIARHIRLPNGPALGPAALALPPEQRVPPLLVINIQLPMYPVRMLAGQHICGVGAESHTLKLQCRHDSLSPAVGTLALSPKQCLQPRPASGIEQCRGADWQWGYSWQPVGCGLCSLCVASSACL